MATHTVNEEKVLVEKTPANLFKGMEAVGGHLKITDKRIIHRPHAINLQGGVTEIVMADIKTVEKANTLGIIPNRIVIKTKDQKVYKFVVYKRDTLVQMILDCLG